jgi:hypothetical protein
VRERSCDSSTGLGTTAAATHSELGFRGGFPWVGWQQNKKKKGKENKDSKKNATSGLGANGPSLDLREQEEKRKEE